MPFLIVRQPNHLSFSVAVRGELTIGRSSENDVVLADCRVSRQHCRITSRNGGWVLEDRGSTHGTLVGCAPVKERALCDGDQIQLGEVLLFFALRDVGNEIIYQQSTGEAAPKRQGKLDRRTQVLQEIGSAIGAARDSDEMLGRVLDAVLDALGCKRAVIALCESEGRLRQVIRPQDNANRAEIVVSSDVRDKLLNQREAIIFESKPKGVAQRGSAYTAMAAPLSLGRRVLGFLYVEDEEKIERFTSEDLDFLVALGHLTAAALDSVERCQRAVAVAEALRSNESATAGELLGESMPMKRLRADVEKFGKARASILIRGESGSGKELVAQALQAASPRKDQPFVAVNCAVFADTLIESELFGHERGAFTGAVKVTKGKFELADKGTLFLDEIGDLSLAAQAKVLRAIQEGEIQRLGAEGTIHVDVRFLAATHKDLKREIAEGRFREDLYYRLNVVEIVVPTLRERSEDVELLAQALLKVEAGREGRQLQGFTPAAMAALRSYPWPGNVRELRNEVQRAVIYAESPWIELTDLNQRVQDAAATAPAITSALRGVGLSLAERYKALGIKGQELDAEERELIRQAYQAAQGNIAKAARLLGITWTMMDKRVTNLGLDRAA